jgi:hypothetical protein
VRFVGETGGPETGEIYPPHKEAFVGPAVGTALDFAAAMDEPLSEDAARVWRWLQL